MMAAATECDHRSLQSGYAANWLASIIKAECHNLYLGVNEKQYYPEEPQEKIRDVAFIGSQTPWRDEVLAELKEAGFAVGAFGRRYSGAKIRPARYRKIVAESGITLGIHREGQMGSFSDRAFRTMACGGFYVCQASREMDDLFLEYNTYGIFLPYAAWEKKDNLVNAIHEYLFDSEHKLMMIEYGRKIVLDFFTWDNFLANILEICDGRKTTMR